MGFAESFPGFRLRLTRWGIAYLVACVVLGLAAFTVVSMPMVGVVTGMLGLLAFEHAYVQAGQSVPLA